MTVTASLVLQGGPLVAQQYMFLALRVHTDMFSATDRLQCIEWECIWGSVKCSQITVPLLLTFFELAAAKCWLCQALKADTVHKLYYCSVIIPFWEQVLAVIRALKILLCMFLLFICWGLGRKIKPDTKDQQRRYS